MPLALRNGCPGIRPGAGGGPGPLAPLSWRLPIPCPCRHEPTGRTASRRPSIRQRAGLGSTPQPEEPGHRHDPGGRRGAGAFPVAVRGRQLQADAGTAAGSGARTVGRTDGRDPGRRPAGNRPGRGLRRKDGTQPPEIPAGKGAGAGGEIHEAGLIRRYSAHQEVK